VVSIASSDHSSADRVGPLAGRRKGAYRGKVEGVLLEEGNMEERDKIK